jgi:hypothetical protein
VFQILRYQKVLPVKLREKPPPPPLNRPQLVQVNTLLIVIQAKHSFKSVWKICHLDFKNNNRKDNMVTVTMTRSILIDQIKEIVDGQIMNLETILTAAAGKIHVTMILTMVNHRDAMIV